MILPTLIAFCPIIGYRPGDKQVFDFLISKPFASGEVDGYLRSCALLIGILRTTLDWLKKSQNIRDKSLNVVPQQHKPWNLELIWLMDQGANSFIMMSYVKQLR